MAEPLGENLDTISYWEGCRQGRLLFQRCRACGEPVFHPRALCPYCLADRLDWEESSGRGEIYSFTVQHVALVPRDPAPSPRVLGIIAMAEGFHIFAEILPEAGTPRIGAPVAVRFGDARNGRVLPKFAVLA
jgi:hypothetical protein